VPRWVVALRDTSLESQPEGGRHIERQPAGSPRCYETTQHPPQVSIRHLCAPGNRRNSRCCYPEILGFILVRFRWTVESGGLTPLDLRTDNSAQAVLCNTSRVSLSLRSKGCERASSSYGSGGWGFESLRACHRNPCSARVSLVEVCNCCRVAPKNLGRANSNAAKWHMRSEIPCHKALRVGVSMCA
jgi:hypothetical protein